MMTLTKHVEQLASSSTNLLQTAEGCRAASFTAMQCAPELYKTFPTTNASALAAVLIEVWGCELSSADLTTALNSCKKTDGSSAYDAAEVSSALSANITLDFLAVANIPTQYGGGSNNQLKMIGLAHGNLAAISQAEGHQFLVISCLPGDYAPVSGSVIAALDTAYGINVANLAQNPAADYRSTHHCWISNELSSSTGKTIPYKQLIVFESTGQQAVTNIPGIFAAIKEYVPTPPALPNTGIRIMSAMVSTGSADANNNQVLDALFNGAYGLMTNGSSYNMTSFRVVTFPPAWSSPLTAEFNNLKTQHGL